MNFELTEAQQQVGRNAQTFARSHLDAMALDLDRCGVFPKGIIDELAGHDFLGLLVPMASGGVGAGFINHIQVVEAFSRSCPAIASILNNHALAAHAVAQWGSDAQKQHYLPPLAKGRKLGTLAIYEDGPSPGIGPDPLLALRQGGGFTLTGTKAFVRNAGVADLYVTFATLEPTAKEPRLTAFLVDADTSGLTIGPGLDTMGLKGCPVAQLFFQAAALGPDALLGEENGGSAIATRLLSLGSLAEAAQTVGIGWAAVKHAAEFATRRVQFGHPIATLQAIQTLLAEAATDCHLAWLGIQRAAQLVEDGAPFEIHAAMVKAFVGRFGSRTLIDAIQVEGGLGISESKPFGVGGTMPLARLFRDMAGTTLLDAPADFPAKLIAESIV
jgi:alkylation response protein AidB-like acyl-CoA dehydrogenase